MTAFVWNCFWLFAVDFINPSAMLGFKFWLLTRTESFKVYSTLKCIQDCTFHHCWQHVKSYRSLQSTKASIIGFITMCIHMEEVKYRLPSTWISRFSTNDESKKFLSCSKNIFYRTPELFHILLYSKNRQKSSLESVSVADMKHTAKYITCCTWVRSHLIYMAVLVQVVICCKPRSFVFTDSCIYFTSSLFVKVLFVVNFIVLMSCRFRENLLAVNHSLRWDRTVFASEGKFISILTRNCESFVFSDKVGGRLFMSIMKSKGPRTEPWGTTYFIISQYEKILSIVRCFLVTFCFLHVR